MKKTILILLTLFAFSACATASAPTTLGPQGDGALAMCAEGVTDCNDMVIEEPQLITGGEFVGAEGNEVTVRLWMGAEPCDVLDRVVVTESDTNVELSITRHAPDPAMICPAIAREQLVTASLQAPLGERLLIVSGVEVAR